jgi:hypothetical protein
LSPSSAAASVQPYAIGLVVAGIGLSLSGYHSGIELTPELVFSVLHRHLRGRRCIWAGTVPA